MKFIFLPYYLAFYNLNMGLTSLIGPRHARNQIQYLGADWKKLRIKQIQSHNEFFLIEMRQTAVMTRDVSRNAGENKN